jgi:hypothetical protein
MKTAILRRIEHQYVVAICPADFYVRSVVIGNEVYLMFIYRE